MTNQAESTIRLLICDDQASSARGYAPFWNLSHT